MVRLATLIFAVELVMASEPRAEPRPFVATYEGGVAKVFRHGRLLTMPDGERWLVLSEDRHGCDEPAWPPGKHHALAIFDAKLTRARLITFNTPHNCYPFRHPTVRIALTGARASGAIDPVTTRQGVGGGGDFDAVVCN